MGLDMGRDIIDRLRDSQPIGTTGGYLLNDAADEILRLRQDNLELLEEVEDSINQSCYVDKEGILDSMALSSYASTLKLLSRLGRVQIISETGRRVIAKWLPRD